MTRGDDGSTTIEPIEATDVSRERAPLAATIVQHPDGARVGQRALVLEDRLAVARLQPEFEPGGPLGTQTVSRRPLWISAEPTGGAVLAAETGSGSLLVDGAPLAGPRCYAAEDLERGVVIELGQRVVLVLHRIAQHAGDGHGFVGASSALDRVRAAVQRLASLEAPVLIRGETGVGKELAARAIHEASERCSSGLVSVNLAAVPGSTASSLLFGHVKGAFTGAVQDHDGHFDQADGGTLFLDEVGAASPGVQAMLLRTLETGEVQPVGASQARRVNVRILAATDEDLEQAMEQGRFRSALYHRLAGYTLDVPPLRERRVDAGLLLARYLAEELAAVGASDRLRQPDDRPPWLPTTIVSRLVRHSWPGNVRQLHNVVRQLVISSADDEVARLDEVLERLLEGDEVLAEAEPAAGPPDEDQLVQSLRANKWQIGPTAADLGVSTATVHRLIDRSTRIRRAKDVAVSEIRAAHEACGGDVDAMAEKLEVSARGLKLRLKGLEIE